MKFVLSNFKCTTVSGEDGWLGPHLHEGRLACKSGINTYAPPITVNHGGLTAGWKAVRALPLTASFPVQLLTTAGL